MPYGAVAAVGAVVGVAGAVEQRKQTKRAEKKAEQADQLQLAQQRLQAQRNRRKQMAQMREAQAANIAASEAAGGGGSAEAGALSSLATQAGSNIGFAKALEGADAGRFSVMQDMNKAQGKAATAGQVSQIGFSVAKGAVNQSPGGFSGMMSQAKDKVTSAFE